MEENTPVIVDVGVQKGLEVLRFVIGSDGVAAAYSSERGEVANAQVWSYEELLKLHPYLNEKKVQQIDDGNSVNPPGDKRTP